MTDLPSVQAYIQSEETDAESPLTEQTLQKIGSSINFINDLFKQVDVYDTPGTVNWDVPSGIERVFLFIAPGGGGGAGSSGAGAGAGAGCIPLSLTLNVTPGDTYAIKVGAGGNGGSIGSDGSDGESSTFIGPDWTIVLNGGEKGTTAGVGGTNALSRKGVVYCAGGDVGVDGESSIFAVAGSSPSGGSGGSGIGAGGAGGATLNNGQPGGTSAGGGGAGGGGGGSNGGDGGDGFILVAY